ncbi:MAG: Uma2 family endonuclease [Candidatus Hydrogenedentes bacterium]|nr:Uma2 family endonuclease [Candidatus Hydrogenedentota bacterium]
MKASILSLGSTYQQEGIILHFGPYLPKLTNREFYEFCQLNPELRIERTAEGDLVIMPPTGGKTGKTNSALTTLLTQWAEADGTGVVFDSSTGFTLPNGAILSPDAAWVRRDRWDALTDEKKEEFPPIGPDFVAEIRSRSDSLKALHAKMREYMANGAQLGWLIDPIEKKISVYSAGADMVCHENPSKLAGDPVLPGFVLEATRLWQ